MAKIISKNPLFKDDPIEIEQPPKASFIFNLHQERVYTCPYCKAQVTYEEADVVGAEPNCMFCIKCNGEFEGAG